MYRKEFVYYVSGLSDTCRKEDLSDYFSEYSHNITDMWIARNPCGFAFMRLRGSREYVDEFVGKFANTELHSRTMNVEIARNQDGPRRKRGHDDSQYGTDRYYGASDRSRNYDDSRYGYSRNDGPRYEDRGYDRHETTVDLVTIAVDTTSLAAIHGVGVGPPRRED